MTDQDFQIFVIDSLNSLKTDVQGLKINMQWLQDEVHGLRDEFYDFREEQRQENAVLRALSAQSFQHISDMKAEMMPTWKAGNIWKANV